MKLETDELTNAAMEQVAFLQDRGQRKTLEEIAALSTAASLKRIADILERNTTSLDQIAACVVPETNMVRVDSF